MHSTSEFAHYLTHLSRSIPSPFLSHLSWTFLCRVHPAVRAACLVVSTLVEEESQLILLLESLAVRACVRALCARTLLNTTQFRM